jgi:NADPH-dependent 2,4-dienoyl-CoA reductase/sulfur reductase-like enzyme/peroxiredoxin family protein/rhodanese-related sulfurtransferase/TusA-related sulfurtransferase
MSQKKILIVGGVAGGASFAARMRRLDESASIIMFDKGDHISFANCGLPYHIGGTIADRSRLIVQTPESFKARYNVEVRVRSEVVSVDTRNKTVTVQGAKGEYKEPYDVLLLAPGAAPLRPPISGIDSDRIFTLRNLNDMDRIIATMKNGATRAAVIGGGFIGLETAENLRKKGLDVTLVELLDQVFVPVDKEMADILHAHLKMNGVRLILKDAVQSFEQEGREITARLKSGTEITADFAVLAVGVKPDTDFLRNTPIALNERGGIIVDSAMRTNVQDVLAVGDAVEVQDLVSREKGMIPLAGPANRQGRIAANTIAGRSSAYRDTQGTAVVKVFDLTAAVTGINEKTARKLCIPYIKSYTHSLSHAGYYPGAAPMTVKLLFAPDTGLVLGAQIIGTEGVDKRIDVLALAVRQQMTVEDLTEQELAYAPPYGSAKDPVNMAGFVAENILSGLMPVFYAEDLESRDPASTVLIDVRDQEEIESGMIPGAVHIPLNRLRSRLGELDTSKEYWIYCRVGLRGYIAQRQLLQEGFRAKNLSGGYTTWMSYTALLSSASFLDSQVANVCSSPDKDTAHSIVREIDASGMQCPGPILQLKSAVDSLEEGHRLRIKATDSGFAMDVPAWCHRTGNALVSLSSEGGVFDAVVQKGRDKTSCRPAEPNPPNGKTIVVFSNDFDRLMAAFIIGNGGAAMGAEVTMFFTFWGLSLLRKENHTKVKKSLVERMFGVMLPRGPKKMSLSKMNMGGLGTSMMQAEMKKKNVMTLPELVLQAKQSGIHLVACTMSMDIMGIKKEELIDGIEYAGVGYYLGKADQSSYNLFI